MERLFGITRFRVDPGLAGVGSTGSEQNAAARITVEQQITRNLTITYVSNVSSTQQQVIQVEYNVDRNVSIAIQLILDLAAARPVAGEFAPDRPVVLDASASGPGPDRSRAVPTARSPDSAASIPPAHP